jgi:hypothetical protein
MSWARRLKRVFGVEIESCTRCGGPLTIPVSIEEPQLIAKILSHLERAAREQYQSELPARWFGGPATAKGSAQKPTGSQIFQASHAAPELGRNNGCLRATRLWAALDRKGV